MAIVVACLGCRSKKTDSTNEACERTYAKLEDLGCVDKMKALIARGCFEGSELAPDDCLSELDELNVCTAEVDAFSKSDGGWWAPLQTFLDRKCGPEGTTTIDWPKPDLSALRVAKEKAAAEAAATKKTASGATSEAAAKQEHVLETVGAQAGVTRGEPKIIGALKAKDVRDVADKRMGQIRRCYAKGLGENSDLRGKVIINFVVIRTGKVGSSVVQESTLAETSVGNCIAKAIKNWKFPKPRGGGNAIVEYPFTLEP